MPLAESRAHLGAQVDIEAELKRGSEISIINLVDGLIGRAYVNRASDIHIDPSSDTMRVRLRVDGVLQDSFVIPRSVHSEIVSRIKVLADLRTDEHAASQDGRFRHLVDPEQPPVDIRVSIVPTYHGENVVMRLLTNNAGEFALDTFGFNAEDLKKINRAAMRPAGMILSTGPTGSGKTTTLYSLLRALNTREVSIVTIEDPIEYAVAGVKQIQVNNRTGLTFANGLRSILRQDPNIIMVGEIRDSETAGIAVNTALTGHLLLSTLHTNDAATTLPRLLDMGIDAYLVASTIEIAIGQRLVRRICAHCKNKRKVTAQGAMALGAFGASRPVVEGEIFYKGKGCSECGGSGYKGRLCINEVLAADDDIRDAIMRRASASELRKIAIKNGMTPMLEDGLEKVRRGDTTIEEVLRVIRD
jgi:type IV pilus assembly protein PilB